MQQQEQNGSLWCYHNVSSSGAERLLQEQGCDGSFLLRPSSSSQAAALSIMLRSRVFHIKIICLGESYQLEGDKEQFASLNDMLAFYRGGKHALKLSDGVALKLGQPLLANSSTLPQERWFHGSISSRKAVELLEGHGEGSYLLRLSPISTFAICVKASDDKVVHIKIHHCCDSGRDKYHVSPRSSFSSIAEVVSFYSTHGMMDRSSHVYRLLKPVFSSTLNSRTIKNRIKDLSSSEPGAGGFADEFMKLGKCDEEFLKKSRNEGKLECNRAKNRFKNILPYDETRVVLQQPKGCSDYINASLIQPQLPGHASYIATQGPLTSTIGDFWRMIWQESVQIIVMITKEVEGNKNKCARYWTSEEEPEKKYKSGDSTIVLRQTMEVRRHEYTQTSLELSLDPPQGPARTVQHMQFLAWPDHSVPRNPHSVLRLLQDIEDISRSFEKAKPQPPIVVHCSAGIGRTGTLIVLHMLINQIEALGINCDLDIFSTTRLLRSQRPGMIQTEAQYRFAYMALLRYIEARLANSKSQQQKAEEVYCT